MKIRSIILITIIVALVLIYAFVPRKVIDKVDNILDTTSEVCTEGQQKLQGTNIFTCVEGDWIYIGQLNENKG